LASLVVGVAGDRFFDPVFFHLRWALTSPFRGLKSTFENILSVKQISDWASEASNLLAVVGVDLGKILPGQSHAIESRELGSFRAGIANQQYDDPRSKVTWNSNVNASTATL
jgi:hypothetical protein